MLGLRATVLLLFLTGAVPGQGDRAVLFIDGRAEDLVRVHGRGRWIMDDPRVRTGVAALRIEPVETEAYPGFTVSNVPTRGGTAVVLAVFLEGDQPKSFRVRVEDDDSDRRGSDDSAIDYVTIAPGWNDVLVPLIDRKTVKGRAMAFSTFVRSIQFTKKYEAGDPAIVFDAVMVRDPRIPKDRPRFMDALAAEADPSRQAKLMKDLEAWSDEDIAAICVEILTSPKRPPRVKRGAREALSRVATPAAARAVADAVPQKPADVRPALVWAVAAMPCRETRMRALSWVRDGRDGKLATADKVAALAGLRLAGGSDVRTLLESLPAAKPWQLRAALVAALRGVHEPESVDALITILGDPGSARVATDAEAALGALTGGDYGLDAATWRDWWRVNRDRVTVGTKPRTTAGNYGRATFYGLAVPEGRVAFVIDTSGSMSEPVGGGKLEEYMKNAGHLPRTKIRTRLDLAAAELTHAVSNMKDGSAVAVISFSANANWITKRFETVTPDLRRKIGERVNALTAGRATNVWAGLHAAYFPTGKPRSDDLGDGPDTIFLLTDGGPSAGDYTNIEELRDEVLTWNLGRAVRINCVNVGDRNSTLLRGLSHGTGGAFVDLRSDRAPRDERP